MHDTNHQQTAPRTPVKATAAELGEFLESVKGKGPREVLGAIAQSRLGVALVQATVGTLVLMVVLTVGPYLLKSNASDVKKAAVQEPEKKDVPEAAKTDTPPAKTTGSGEPKTTATADGKKDQAKPAKDVVDKLGENQVKKDKPKDPFGTGRDDDLPGLKDK